MSEKKISLPSPEKYLDLTFGEGGFLAQRFDGYRPRAGQVALARAVDSSLSMGDHALAEAPTGTGKSIAYLVPATYRTAKATEEELDDTKRHVVVVTANIALQEQLIEKDLPLLREILPWDFSFSLLKGKNHYLCLDAYYDMEAKGFAAMPSPDDLDQIEEIRAWASDCARGLSSGDVSELSFEPSYKNWRHFSVSTDECKGKPCRFYNQCFSVSAHKKARSANIIVTNYHMLLAHLQVRNLTGKDLVLPPFGAVILDEAHKLADISREFFGFKVTPEAIRRTARLFKKSHHEEDRQLCGELEREAAGFFYALDEYKRSPSYKTRIKRPLEESFKVHGPWKALEKSMFRIEDIHDYRIRMFETQIKNDLGDPARARTAAADHYRARDRSKELRGYIDNVMKLSLSEDVVYFIDTDEKQRTSLVSKPIRVGPQLKKNLFDPTPSVICVSATMCVGDSFDFIAEEIGCPRYSKLITESPFAWSDQALLITPDDMPQPNDRDFREAVAESVLEVIKRARGRTLGLFTSRKNLELVHEYVKNCGFTVYKQGQAPRTKLIEAFRRDVSSVLLGTESFWAGVDVPGESLSAVVIDRLPFPNPDDPIADAIAERDEAWFRNFAVPRAVIQFKQGFGRLIRSTNDAGVVVVLDRRIIDKPYGRLFIKSLPDVSVDRSLERISSFLRAS